METFRLVSEFQPVHRRSFELADPTLLRPTAAKPVIMGEWFGLNTSYQMARGSGTQSVPTFAYFSEEGRYDNQAINKGSFLLMGPYEAETLFFDGTLISAVGQRLFVGNVTYGGVADRQGLIGVAGPTTEVSIGIVTRLPANNNGWLRFIRTMAA